LSEQKKALTRKERIELRARLRKQKLGRIFGMALASVFLVISIVFLVFLMQLNMIPDKYLIAIVVVLVLILMYVFISQFTRTHIIGKVLSVILSVILAMGCWYIHTARVTINNISSNDTVKIDSISVIVLADNAAQSIEDTAAYTFGRNSVLDIDLTDDTIHSLNEKLGTTINVEPFDTWSDVISALYNGTVDAIILNESYRSTIEEEYLNFSSETKVLDSRKFTSTIVLDTSDKEISKEAFIIYLSGNDSNGNLASSGRSDVNILAAINPSTKTILLVTVPRDSYVQIVNSDKVAQPGKDKLTHAGIGGVSSSINTLANLFDLDIDYYLRLNFTGIINLVDALGGITVYSDYTFTTYDTTHTFVQGENYMNGEDAMYFARERHAFANGDFQRNKNQVKVIEAIIAKACSTKILTNYAAIMDSLKGVVETNVPEDQIAKLVKMQLNDMSSWNILSYGITGQTGSADCYGRGYLSIVYPDTDMIEEAKREIAQVMAGEPVTQQ
jgi:LCP family protein required for cell wall assembly